MASNELANAKTFSEFLELLEIKTDDNVSYDEFSCDNAAKMSKQALMQNFQFDKSTAKRIFEALAAVRKLKKMEKPGKLQHKHSYLPSLLASAFGYHLNVSATKFSDGFTNLEDIKFIPGDEWPMDLCSAAEAASSTAFQIIHHQAAKFNPDWKSYSTKEGWTPLMYAAALGRGHIVDYLLKLDVSIKSRSEDGQTALMLAASFGHEKIIERLASHVKRKSGLYQNNLKSTIVKDLLTLNCTDKRGYSALHYAAYFNQAEAVQALLKEGADPNLADNLGMTPTLVACVDEAQESCLKILVRHGGNLDFTNSEGKNGFELSGSRSSIFELKLKIKHPHQSPFGKRYQLAITPRRATYGSF